MSDLAFAQVFSDHHLAFGEGGETVTVTVTAGDTVYWGDRQCSAAQNQGVLTVGQSTTITAAQIWLISASTSMVQIYGVPQTSNTGGGGSGGSSTLQGLTDVSEAASMNLQALVYNTATGTWSNQPVVNSFNRRTGAVVPQTGDYTPAQVGALAAANNLSDVANIGSSRLNLHVSALAVCQVAATANVTLSGLQTIGAYTTLSGDLVLCVGQTTASQNGPWLAAAGTWTRPNEYATGASIIAGRTVAVVNPPPATEWVLTTAGTVIVGTTATTWVQTLMPAEVAPGSLGASQTLSLNIPETWLIGTITANLVVNVTNLAPSAQAVLLLTMGGSGGYTVTIASPTTLPITLPSTTAGAQCEVILRVLAGGVIWASVASVAVTSAGSAGAPTVVTGATTSITTTTVTIAGTGNPNSVASTYQFQYSTDLSFGLVSPSSFTAFASDGTVHSLSANLTGLTPGTSYNYRLVCSNADGTVNGSTNTFTTTGIIPANTAVPTISGTAQQGNTLTATTGTWNNAPTSYAYQWKSASSNVGTNQNTYVLQASDVGNQITVVVTASNVTGSSTPATSAPTAYVSASSATPTLGVYIGGGNRSGFASFASWLGKTPAYVVDFLVGTSWSTIGDPSWVSSQWAGSGAKLVFSVSMLPSSGATLAAGASGSYDSYFTTLANALVSEGNGDIIIRLGWEMNGNWFPWSIQGGNESNYAAFFRRIVTAMRAVSPNFKFDWCPACGSSYVSGAFLNSEACYPGDGYVDYIGLDLYDQSWVTGWNVESNRWASYLTEPYGLNWHKAFAATHGKQVSFPEWGLMTGGNGGGDSPPFVQNMYDWMAASNLGYQSYFDFSNSVLSGVPNAQALYKTLFGP